MVDIGHGQACVFKIESHNHPSAVEPFHGAGTGVGGILRDVFSMGARPLAVLNSLRLGELDNERSKYLFREIVAGIAHYGNTVQVPTVGGEVQHDPCYEHNPLVNAMAVGLVQHGNHLHRPSAWQDMGSSRTNQLSSAEMASKAGTGIELNLDLVPKAEYDGL